MVTFGFQQSSSHHHPQTEAERLRVEREEAIIAKAEADIDAGLGIDDDTVEAWLDTLDQNPDAPLPSPFNGTAIR